MELSAQALQLVLYIIIRIARFKDTPSGRGLGSETYERVTPLA